MKSFAQKYMTRMYCSGIDSIERGHVFLCETVLVNFPCRCSCEGSQHVSIRVFTPYHSTFQYKRVQSGELITLDSPVLFQKRNPMFKPLSLILLIGGVVLIVLGVIASRSLSSDISRFFTGTFTEKAVWLLVIGTIFSIVGFIGLLRRSSTGDKIGL